MKKGFTLIELLVVLMIIGVVGSVVFSAFHKAPTAQAAGCGGFFQPSCNSANGQQQNEQESVAATQNRLENAVKLPRLETSLERLNIKKRLETFSDENKVSYVYLVSFGKVMAFYTIKGKITSGNKRLTSTQRLVSCDKGQNYGDCEMESPELDGTYGSSSPYIFFWTTDGVYVQWSGEYMLVDQPLKLTTQPELIRNIK